MRPRLAGKSSSKRPVDEAKNNRMKNAYVVFSDSGYVTNFYNSINCRGEATGQRVVLYFGVSFDYLVYLLGSLHMEETANENYE